MIVIWDVKGRCRVQQSKPQKQRILNLAVSAEGLIAAASADGHVLLFRQSEGRCGSLSIKGSSSKEAQSPMPMNVIPDGELPGHGSGVLGITFNSNGSRLVSSAEDKTIRIWGYKTPGFSLAQLSQGSSERGEGDVTTVAISPDGDWIAVGDQVGNIRLWNQRKTEADPLMQSVKATWSAHDNAVQSIAFLQLGHRLALVSGGEDGAIKRWDVETQSPIDPVMTDEAKPIRSFSLSSNGTTLAAGSIDGTIRLWDMETGRRITRIEGPKGVADNYELHAVAFTADGKYLAVGDNQWPPLYVRRVQDMALSRRLVGHADYISSMSNGHSSWLLSTGKEGRVLVWSEAALEQAESREAFTFQLGYGKSTPLTAIDMSRDSEWIVFGGKQGRLELWDGVEHVQIASHFDGHDQHDIRGVKIAQDGTSFVTADYSTILLWPGPNRWADIICSKLSNNMSKKQWSDWISPEIEYREQCPGLPILDEATAK